MPMRQSKVTQVTTILFTKVLLANFHFVKHVTTTAKGVNQEEYIANVYVDATLGGGIEIGRAHV